MHTASHITLVGLAAAVVSSPRIAHAGLEEHLAVVATDYQSSGSLSVMPLTAPFAPQVDVETVGVDPVIRYWHDHIYVVNRFGNDAVQVIDPVTHDTEREFSVGPLSNPQDIAVVDASTAFVSRLGSRWLYVVNPTTGAIADSVDLGSFADADGRPEMSYMALAGNRLFVQVQRLDTNGSYNPVPPSYMAVIDVPSRTLVDVDPVTPGTQAITLTSTNPQQKMHLDEVARRLYVAETGRLGVLDGGIEAIDIDTFQPLGFVLTEVTVGGDVSTPVLASSTRGYTLTSPDFFFTTTITAFNPSTGTVTGSLHTTPSFTSGLVFDAASERLYLADPRTTQPGIRVFDTNTDTQITAVPVSVGLPPVDMAVVRAPAVDVAENLSPPAGRIAAVPNPFVHTTTITIRGPAARAGIVDVFGADGRRVRTLSLDGVGAARWDGTDDGGRHLAPGVYAYRARRGTGAGHVILLR